MRTTWTRYAVVAALAAAMGCSSAPMTSDGGDSGDGATQADATTDGSADTTVDVAIDGAADATVDAVTDRGALDAAAEDSVADVMTDPVAETTDAPADDSTVGTDTGVDVDHPDAGTDAGTDAAVDAGTDVRPDTAPVCSVPMTACGGSCVNLATSSANCGACGVACPSATPVCVASRCVCTTFYVSQPNGNDANDGCSPATPKQTIAAAITAASAVMGATPGPQVLVCAGTYFEAPLTLNAPVSIHGGYDCSAWTRTTTFGYPAFDGANTTTVSNASYLSVDTMVVTGAAVGPAVVIDGLSIQGATSSGVGSLNGSNGLHLRMNARPHITDNVIVGGGGVDGGHGTNGVVVDTGAAPELAHNSIEGSLGDGARSHGQATGVYLATTAGAIHIHDNVIVGGDQFNTQANGIYDISPASLTQANGAAIENNTITAATTTMGGGGPSQSNAVMVYNTSGSVDVISNVLDGTGQTRAVGIYANSTSGPIRILQNRIYAGQKNGYLGGGTTGIWLASADGVEITNNMIHGGSKNGANATSTAGIELDFSSGAIIRHNTIYVGRRGSGGVAVAINVFRSSRERITNNILMGSGSAAQRGSEVGLSMAGEGCPVSGGITTLRANAFLNFVSGLSFDQCAGSAGTTFTTIDLLEQDITANSPNGPIVGLDRVVRTACPSSPAETGCISWACGTDPGCIFPAWNIVDTGYAALVAPMNGGWRLTAGDPCGIVQSGLADSSEVPTDLFGVMRAPTTSIGAHQFAGMCM